MKILHEIGLHKPDSDETLYNHIYVTRRITACCSRGCNGAVGYENTCFFEERRAEKLRFLPRGERDTVSLFKYEKYFKIFQFHLKLHQIMSKKLRIKSKYVKIALNHIEIWQHSFE